MSIRSGFRIRTVLQDFKKLRALEIAIKKSDGNGLFYICNHHLGDILIFCSLAKTLRRIEKRKITIVVEQRYQSIPKLFGFDALVTDIPKFEGLLKETYYLFYLSLSNLLSKGKILLSVPGFFLFIKSPRKIIETNMYFRYMIALGARDILYLSCIDNSFETVPIHAKTFFVDSGFQIKRTVIISPDSTSMKDIKRSFFIKLYNELKKIDFIPVINSNNPFWIESNFRTFFPDPLELLYYTILSGYSISARNGVSDMVSFTPGVKNIVIYNREVPTDLVFGNAKEFLCANVDEYFYEEFNEHDLIKSILYSIQNERKKSSL